MRILALDQATKCGYSIIDDGVIFTYGVADFSKLKEWDEKVHSIKTLLKKLVLEYNPDAVIFEEVYAGIQNISTYGKLSMLLGVLIDFCFEKEIAYMVVSPQTWRSTLGIQGKTKEDVKRNAIEYIHNEFGINEESDVCDAICIGLASYILCK
jgi:Holliday junction resolvasome RuvABC endonuclease subunit